MTKLIRHTPLFGVDAHVWEILDPPLYTAQWEFSLSRSRDTQKYHFLWTMFKTLNVLGPYCSFWLVFFSPLSSCQVCQYYWPIFCLCFSIYKMFICLSVFVCLSVCLLFFISGDTRRLTKDVTTRYML